MTLHITEEGKVLSVEDALCPLSRAQTLSDWTELPASGVISLTAHVYKASAVVGSTLSLSPAYSPNLYQLRQFTDTSTTHFWLQVLPTAATIITESNITAHVTSEHAISACLNVQLRRCSIQMIRGSSHFRGPCVAYPYVTIRPCTGRAAPASRSILHQIPRKSPW